MVAVASLLAGGLSLLTSAASPVYAAAVVINVPGDQPTIQAAVSAAASGDTILIAPGTYTGGVWGRSRRSPSPPGTRPPVTRRTSPRPLSAGTCRTPVAAPPAARATPCWIGSRAGGSVVNGLTVANGVDGVRGNSPVTISHSRMIANGDGADFGNDSSGTFSNDVFASNTDDGIDLNGRVAMTLVDSTIQENQGDGIEFRMYPYIGATLNVDIRRNRFVRNDSDGASSRVVRIERNVFDHNGAASVGCLANQQTNEDFSGAPLAERVYVTNNTFSGERYGVVGGANSIVLNNIFTGTRASALRGAPDLGFSEYTGGPPLNRAPTVNAGPDQTLTLPSAASLDGTVADDGLPGAGVTTAWSQVSGPGTTAFADSAAVDTTATFSAAGTYVLQLSATDGELTAGDTVQITVQPAPPPGGAILERRVAASTDDAEESATGSYSASSTDLELVYDGSNQKVGIRFTNLAVPAGATITRAYVQFEADETQSEATTVSIQGQAADNALTFSSATKMSTRSRTTAATTWTPAPWTLVGEAGANQRTPDLTAVIQEIVGRPGWASGNALALIITGTGHRTTRAYDGKPAAAPLLHLEYTTG